MKFQIKKTPERDTGYTNPLVYGFAYTSTYKIYIRNLTQFVPYLDQIRSDLAFGDLPTSFTTESGHDQ